MACMGRSLLGRKVVVSVVVEVEGRPFFVAVVLLLLLLLLFDLFLLLLGDEPLLLLMVTELMEREKDSNAVAITMTTVSGKASIVPGSPQSGSCFLHHPSEVEVALPASGGGGVVDPSLWRYARLVSDAAAHRRGMAASPLGVSNMEVLSC